MRALRYYLRISLSLLLICTVVALLLSAVNIATRDVIAAREQEERQTALATLYPALTDIEDAKGSYPEGVLAVYALYADGQLLGHAVELVSRGFGGDIRMLVGITTEGSVCGTEILAHSETPGLGSRATEQAHLLQFVGMQAGGSSVDAITGATVSSRAIERGVSLALSLFEGGDAA